MKQRDPDRHAKRFLFGMVFGEMLILAGIVGWPLI
jgi:hypothetical protein